MTTLHNTTVSLSRDSRSKSLVVSLDGGPLGVRVSLSPKKDSPGERELTEALLWGQVNDFPASTTRPLQAGGRLWESNGAQRNSESLIPLRLITADNDYEAGLLPMTYYLLIDARNRTLQLSQPHPEQAHDIIDSPSQKKLIEQVQRRISEIATYRLMDLPEEEQSEATLVKVRTLDVGDRVLMPTDEVINRYSSNGDVALLLQRLRVDQMALQIESITSIGANEMRVVYGFDINVGGPVPAHQSFPLRYSFDATVMALRESKPVTA